MFSIAVYVRAARCGVSRTLSSPSSGKSGFGGSGSKTSIAAAGEPLVADRVRQRGGVQDLAAAGVDQDRVGFISASCSRADQVLVAGQHVDVQAQDVGLAEERRLIDRRRGEGGGLAAGDEVEQVVVDHPHAEAVRGDVPDPPADPAHAQDADRQLVQLPAAQRCCGSA